MEQLVESLGVTALSKSQVSEMAFPKQIWRQFWSNNPRNGSTRNPPTLSGDIRRHGGGSAIAALVVVRRRVLPCARPAYRLIVAGSVEAGAELAAPVRPVGISPGWFGACSLCPTRAAAAQSEYHPHTRHTGFSIQLPSTPFSDPAQRANEPFSGFTGREGKLVRPDDRFPPGSSIA
jgi:hypothetical protein